jgi:hypothetical protein
MRRQFTSSRTPGIHTILLSVTDFIYFYLPSCIGIRLHGRKEFGVSLVSNRLVITL